MTTLPGDWPGYLDAFHEQRTGITEATLGRSTSAGVDPYDWLLEPLGNGAPVLDLACGSGPLVGRRPGSPWVGVDRSASELARFAGRPGGSGVLADAGGLPLRSGTFSNVACSMAIMVLQPLDAVLAELHRVLAPGAHGALLLPGRRPLNLRDLLRYGRIMVAVRRTHLAFPNDGAPLPSLLAGAGFTVVSDQRRRFGLPLDDRPACRLFVDSLYLPGCPPERLEAAARAAERWVGHPMGIPLRRIVFIKA